jgi:preprotein translocase subunit Sec61beta
MANQGISLPSGSGGLMRYSEEYKSRIQIKPSYVIIFIILILLFIAVLKIFYPIATSVAG